jgi:hypothetical protein
MILGGGENALPSDSPASFDSSEERPVEDDAADKTPNSVRPQHYDMRSQ